jgi:alkylation response protein AidB-like acyl-CoA dehydrogenase
MSGIDLAVLTQEAEAFAAKYEADFERFEAAASVEAEIEAFRHAHALVREGGWFRYAVPEAFGGHAAGDSATPESVCVRAFGAIRQAFAFRHAMLDLAFVEQGLGSFPIALGHFTQLHSAEQPSIGESSTGSAIDAELSDVLMRTAAGELIPALCQNLHHERRRRRLLHGACANER